MPALFAVAIIVFLEIVSLGATITVLPRFNESLGGSAAWVGVLFTLVTAPKIVLNPFWGRLSDRSGRRLVLGIGILGSLAASLLWVMSNNLALLTISRVVGGVFAAQATMAYAVAADTTTPDRRTAAMGVLGAAFGIGMTIGLPLGGIIGSHSYAAVGWLGVVCQCFGLFVLLFLLKETRPDAPREHIPAARPTAAPHFELTRLPRVRLVLAIVLLLTLAMAVLFPTLSLLTDDWFGWDVRTTGYAFAVWGLIGIIVQGGAIRPIVRRLGEPATIALGGLALAAGLAGFGAMPLLAAPSLTLFWIALVLIGIGGALAVPATAGLISLQVADSQQGAAQGLNQSATSLGRAIGYLPAAALLGAFGAAAPYFTAAAATLLAVLLMLFAKKLGLKTGHTPPPAPPPIDES